MGEIPSIRFLVLPLADCGGLPLLLKSKYLVWAAAAHKDKKKTGARGHGESRGSEMYAAEPSLYVDVAVHAASMRARNRNGPDSLSMVYISPI